MKNFYNLSLVGLIFFGGLTCYPSTSQAKVTEDPTDTSGTESQLISRPEYDYQAYPLLASNMW